MDRNDSKNHRICADCGCLMGKNNLVVLCIVIFSIILSGCIQPPPKPQESVGGSRTLSEAAKVNQMSKLQFGVPQVMNDPVVGQSETMVAANYDALHIEVPSGYEQIVKDSAEDYENLPRPFSPLTLYFSAASDPRDAELSTIYGYTFETAATTVFGENHDTIYVWGTGSSPRALDKYSLAHELGHTMDGEYLAISNGKGYTDAIEEDKSSSGSNPGFVSEYATQSTAVYKGTYREHAEDFAEAVARWTTDRSNFTKDCPNRVLYLTKILEGGPI